MVEMSDIAGAEFTYAMHEHRELRAGVEEIHTVASAIGWGTTKDAMAAVWRIRSWFSGVFVPHAAWEDAVVYPEIERTTNTDWSTKLMRFEHYQIERAATKLDADADVLRGALTHDQTSEIRGHLFGLEALLRAHLEREELFLLPLLAEQGGASETEGLTRPIRHVLWPPHRSIDSGLDLLVTELAPVAGVAEVPDDGDRDAPRNLPEDPYGREDRA